MSKKRAATYDMGCWTLAEAFGSDCQPPLTETELDQLAEEIQCTIEGWLASNVSEARRLA